MAGGNRQQKQAAKAVRRKQAVAAKQQAERLASSLSGRIAVAAAGPVERCLRTADMAEAGVGHVIVAKRLASGALGCAFFLVDLLCLGVKDAYYREIGSSDLDERVAELTESGHRPVPIDPASAKAAIKGAAAFAAESGLPPARDYPAVVRIFDGVDEAAATERFPFGRDGKAVYVPGPNDSYAKIRAVERVLTRTRGDGWDIDPLGGLSPSNRIALTGIVDALDRTRGRGGAVIEHEEPTGAIDDAAAVQDRPPDA